MTRSSDKNVFFNVIMVMLVVIIALGAATIYFAYRLSASGGIVYSPDVIADKVREELARKNKVYVDNNPLLYRLGDNPDSVWGRTTNGYRPPDVTSLGAKRSGERRVLVVGDSNAFGLGVPNPDDIFTGVLNRMAKRQGLDLTVVNISAPSYNITQCMEAIATFYDLVKPDAVVYQYRSNDHYQAMTPYQGTYTTVWNLQHILQNAPFYSELDVVNLILAYPKVVDHSPMAPYAYSWHPIFRQERLSLFKRLKETAVTLKEQNIPFAILDIAPVASFGLALDPILEEALDKLSIPATVWRNTFVYKEPKSAPSHPDAEGHRVLAGEIYYGLKQFRGFADLPDVEEFKKSYTHHTVTYPSPDALPGSYHKAVSYITEALHDTLSPTISFPPDHEAMGVTQLFGRITPKGFASYTLAALLPGGTNRNIRFEFDIPHSPFVTLKPLKINFYNVNGPLGETFAVAVPGHNRIVVPAPGSDTIFVTEINFPNVYYSAHASFPYGARISQIALEPVEGHAPAVK